MVMKLTNPGHIEDAKRYFSGMTVHPSERYIWDIPLKDEVGTYFLWYHSDYPSSKIPREVKEYFGKSVSSSRLNPNDPLKEMVDENGREPVYVSRIVEYPGRYKDGRRV